MARRGKRLFDSFKRRGEWVELLFMTVASGLGFNVARPWGDSGRYDVATEHEGHFLRIQVKSTEMWLGTCYLCQLYAYGQRAYTAKEIDYTPSTSCPPTSGTYFRSRRWRECAPSP
jgi:PD-(D/E)XK endonuclease